MPELDFHVDAVDPVPYAASPQLAFKLRIVDRSSPGVLIHSVMLRVQIRLEPGRRRYQPAEQDQLMDLFGEPHRWGQTVRPMLWTNLTTQVPPFTGQTQTDLIVPCTFDFNIATTKYFAALTDGDIALSFQFSGTIFYAGEAQPLQVEQISWEKEATFKLPVATWRGMIETFYPNTAWLCLRRDLFDRLNRYKAESSSPTLEQALESLLNSTSAVDEATP